MKFLSYECTFAVSAGPIASACSSFYPTMIMVVLHIMAGPAPVDSSWLSTFAFPLLKLKVGIGYKRSCFFLLGDSFCGKLVRI